jgi:hypothetical protein
MSSKRYGNDHYWAFLEEDWDNKEVAIWKGPDGQEEVIARVKDKYDARLIVDALLNYVHIEDRIKFGKKERAFLEFVCAHCVEPYSTMAANALLWNDREIYEKLKTDFPSIYK